MSVSSRIITLAAAGSGGTTGGGTVSTFQSDVILNTCAYDTTYGAETVIPMGTIGPYWNGSASYYSIFMCKVLSSDGSVSQTYYDNQGATGAWFPNAYKAVIGGSFNYGFGPVGVYKLGFTRYQFSSSFGSGSAKGNSNSTAFTQSGCLGNVTNRVYSCGLDLFGGSDYRGTVQSQSVDGSTFYWGQTNSYITNVNDRCSSMINDSSDNLYVAMNWSDGSSSNKIPGMWKLNSSGTTQFSYYLNQSSSIVDVTSNCSQDGKGTDIDASNNIYTVNSKTGASALNNSRALTYIYSINTSGTIRWAKAIYKTDYNLQGHYALKVASDGDIWICGTITDVATSVTKAFFAKLDSSNGDLLSFTTIENATGVASAYVTLSSIIELSSGKLAMTGRWNGDGTEALQFIIEPNTVGDFGDFVFEDFTSQISEVTDSSASFSSRGSQSSYSGSMSGSSNNQAATVTTSVMTL